ncbi:MAG: FAD binding domain-containing protein [Bradymonadia bacterium]
MLTCHAEVITPTTLDEALAARATHPEASPLAGGTDLMVAIELGSVAPKQVINLWSVQALKGITEVDGQLKIGALTTYTDLIHDTSVQAYAPTLVEASRTVGAVQIQNRGTLGGNIAGASPAGDTMPVLMSLDAEIEVASAARGARRIPMAELYVGYRTLAIEADELLTAIWLPARHVADHTHFRKVGTRLAQAISKVMFGGRARIEGGIVTEARVAFGSVAATTVRCSAVEAALVGKAPDAAAADLLRNDITPIDDVRSTADYRMAVATRTLRAWLSSLPQG